MKNKIKKLKNSLKFFSEGALLFSTLIWGGTFVIIKDSLSDVSTMLFVGIRFFAAALLLLPFVYKQLKGLDRKLLLKAMLLGTFLFLGFAPQTVGLKYTSATKSGFITGAFILFIPVLQLLIEKKKPTLGSVIGSIFVVAGLIFLSVKDSSVLQLFQELGSDFNTGDFLTLICAMFFAVQVVYLDQVSKEINFMVLTFVQLCVTSVLAFTFSALLSVSGIEAYHFNLSGKLIFGLLYTVLLATILNLLIQTRFQKEVSPAKAGIIYSFEPMFSAMFAYIMLNEKISGMGIIGGVFIFSGLLISEFLEWLKQRKEGQSKEIEEESLV